MENTIYLALFALSTTVSYSYNEKRKTLIYSSLIKCNPSLLHRRFNHPSVQLHCNKSFASPSL